MKFRHVMFIVLFAIVMLIALGVSLKYISEFRSEAARRVQTALVAGGYDWVRLDPDGFEMTLSGETDDPAKKIAAETLVAGVDWVSRVHNRITVNERHAPSQPYALRIQRDDASVTLAGETPSEEAHSELLRLAAARLRDFEIIDLVRVRAGDTDGQWMRNAEAAVDAAAYLRIGEISVARDKVAVSGSAAAPEGVTAISAALRGALPDSVTVETDVTAPAPTLSPYPFAVSKTADGGVAIVCAMPDEASLDALIEAAARVFGGAATLDCMLAAGAPETGWIAAAEAGMTAVAALNSGRFELTDLSGRLSGEAENPAARVQSEGALATVPEAYLIERDLQTRAPLASPFAFSMEIAAGRLAARGALPPEVFERLGGYAGVDLAEAFPARGAPDDQWGAAMLAAADVAAQLREGALTIEDRAFHLTGLVEDAARAEALSTEFAAAAPDGYDFAADIRAAAAEGAATPAEPTQAPAALFMARRSEGGLEIGGVAPDDSMREAVASYARAVFPSTPLRDDLIAPENGAEAAPGWAKAAMAALDALQNATDAEATLSRGLLAFDGPGYDAISDEALVALEQALPPGYRLHARAAAPERQAEPDAAQAEPAAGSEDGAVAEDQSPAAAPNEEATMADAAAPPQAQQDAAVGESALNADDCASLLNIVSKRDRILFGAGSAEIEKESYQAIRTLAAIVQRCDKRYLIEIGGHTDSSGSAGSNKRLSENRARAVGEAMVKEGVDKARIEVVGYGETKPIASNRTAEGKAENRRIEFILKEPR